LSSGTWSSCRTAAAASVFVEYSTKANLEGEDVRRRHSKRRGVPWRIIPHRIAILTHGHVDLVLARATDRVELLQQELDELRLLLLVDLGQTIDDDKGIEALLQLYFVFLAEIRDINLILIELILVEVSLAEVIERRRHAGRTVFSRVSFRYARERGRLLCCRSRLEGLVLRVVVKENLMWGALVLFFGEEV
jgi:hypothetical protein